MSYSEYLNAGVSSEPQSLSRQSVAVEKEYEKKAAFDLAGLGRKYDHQFYAMYQYRLDTLKKRADDQAMQQWGDGTKKVDGQTIVRVDTVLNVKSNQLCWVSGTVFSDLKNKLDILGDVEKGTDDVLPHAPSSYISGEEADEEVIMLEDESGRAILQGEMLNSTILVTGVIIAVLGIELQAGMFEIVDIVYPQIAPQRPLKAPAQGKVAFVSGLDIGNSANYDLKLHLLKQYLSGYLGNDKDRQTASEIGHLVIAGNSAQEVQQEIKDDFTSLNNYGSKNISQFNVESLRSLDLFIGDLVATCNVSLIPGESDPTEICLPQQELHKSFFPSSRAVIGTNFKLCTNPCWLEISGVRLLGSAGVNVQDVIKYLGAGRRQEENIVQEVLKSMIIWQNIVPTAPDTLYCYPFDDSDPFTLSDETPQILFAGNQSKFESTTISVVDKKSRETKVQLLSIPKFSQTGQLIVLDLATYHTEVVQFQT